MRRVSEDIRSYYEIAYTPTLQRYDGRFRSVTVQVDRPNLKVQTRDGYFALPASISANVPAYEVPLLKSLTAIDAPRAFNYNARLFHFARKEKDTMCALVVEVPFTGLTFARDVEGKLFRSHLYILALIKNSDGEVVERISQDFPIQAPAARMDSFRAGSFVFTERRLLTPGRYTLETAVSDRESERISTAKSGFVVPAFTPELALSSLSLIRRVEPQGEAMDVQDPFTFPGGKITPNLTGVIPGRAGFNPSFYFVIYPSQASNEPELSIEVLRGGVLVGRTTPPLNRGNAWNRIPYVATVAGSALEPGNYEVRVITSQGPVKAMEQTSVTVTAVN